MNVNYDIDFKLQEEKNSMPPRISYGWLRAVLFIFAGFAASMAFGVLGELFVFNFTGITIEEARNSSAGFIQAVGPYRVFLLRGFGFGGLFLAVWLFRRFIDRKSLVSLGFKFRNYSRDFFEGLAWGIVTISIGFIFLLVVGGVTITHINFDPVSFFGYFIALIIVALNEEIMVRGYILNNLFTSMNRYLALAVSSFFFSALHLMNSNFSFFSFLNIFLAGIFLGIYYVHKQNLWFPIGLHLTWNLFQGPVFGFEVSGHIIPGILTIEKSSNTWLTGGEFGFEASVPATIIIIAASIFIHFRFKKSSGNFTGQRL